MTTWADFQPRELIARLTARGVDFVVVGGYAALLHGSPRLTQDLDISYSLDVTNLHALGEVLIALEARLYGIDDDVPFVPDARALSQVSLLTLDTSAGKLDLLASPEGAPPYAKLREHATRADIGGVVVHVASVQDLIAMKEAAGRAKDRGDIAELEAIQRLRSEKRGR
jgi:predicted nucleotidyltransferase